MLYHREPELKYDYLIPRFPSALLGPSCTLVYLLWLHPPKGYRFLLYIAEDLNLCWSNVETKNSPYHLRLRWLYKVGSSDCTTSLIASTAGVPLLFCHRCFLKPSRAKKQTPEPGLNPCQISHSHPASRSSILTPNPSIPVFFYWISLARGYKRYVYCLWLPSPLLWQ